MSWLLFPVADTQPSPCEGPVGRPLGGLACRSPRGEKIALTDGERTKDIWGARSEVVGDGEEGRLVHAYGAAGDIEPATDVRRVSGIVLFVSVRIPPAT